MRSASTLVALTIAAAVLLTGCVPPEPDIVPPPEPTTEPVFATDEEALAAATDAYKAYLAMSDLIAQEGGKEPERIAPFVTEEWLLKEVEAFSELSASGNHQVGDISVTASELQTHSTDPSGVVAVGMYFCLDFSSSEFVSVEGAKVTPASRPTKVTVEVQLTGWAARSGLLVEGIEPWPTPGIC